jgi:type IV pilus assembly protein PilY1
MKTFTLKSVVRKTIGDRMRHLIIGAVNFLLALAVCNVQAAPPAQTPLFLAMGAKPHIALVMSVDHELFKKAYTDYANLDGGNLSMADTTYRNDFDYYGYFASDWCYTYSAATANADSYFAPASRAADHYCAGTGAGTLGQAGAWSGNFLNWLSMTRVDIVRRVLFGGKRSVDAVGNTILERAYLPQDVHAFAKVYAGSDISQLTPFSTTTSFCNVSTTTMTNNRPAGYPKILIASGSFPQWASAESTQCTLASSSSVRPAAASEVTVKAQVCVTDMDTQTLNANGTYSPSPRCAKYGNNYKPVGLLQKYGESGQIKFSLTTGSYKANLKGGVLRKAAKPLVGNATATDNEINPATGQWAGAINSSNVFTQNDGIIKNISSFRIGSHNGSTNYYDCSSHSISIDTVKTGTTNSKRCSDWGNPLAEIYMEMLRYISGATAATTDFDVDDATASGTEPSTGVGNFFKGIPGLSKAVWDDPWPADEWCAQCSAIVISTGANSFDGDDLATAKDIVGLSNGASDVFAKTDFVGSHIITANSNYFLGGLTGVTPATTPHRYCDGVSLSKLSNFLGVCPEQPALEGTYNIAGLAYHARTTDLRTHQGDQKLRTYAVDFAESVPTFSVSIPATLGGAETTVNFLPACEANSTSSAATNATGGWQGCSLTDVRIESLTRDANGNLTSGSFLFFWEDSLWGNDYDLDAAQRIEFCVGSACSPVINSNNIYIRNTVPYAVAGNALRFSYSIYGVSGRTGTVYKSVSETSDTDVTSATFGGGLITDWIIRPGSNNDSNMANGLNPDYGWSEITFTASSNSTATVLQKPLFYAAKFGGFDDKNGNNLPDSSDEWDRDEDGIPDNFFSVKNPSLLEESLEAIFAGILKRTASASAVATSSTRLQEGQFVYQAVFDSANWSGALRSYEITAGGGLPDSPTLTTASTMSTSATGRNVYTYKSDGAFSVNNVDGSTRTTVPFTWSNLHSEQQAKLALPGDVAGTDQKRVNWLLGDKTDENSTTGLRVRDYEDSFGTKYRNILGDIVNSSPAFVGAYNHRYYGLPVGLGGDTYTDYLAWKKGASLNGYPAPAVPRVFVGANDGALHAFDANTLQELFAYIPNASFHKLAKLTQPDYGSAANPHQFLVDGPILSGDAFISTPSDSTKKWRSIVVGTLGAGAKGIYALDVTNESAPEVLFEYAHADMGYILGRPFIAPTAEGRWAVITGNGIDSGSTSKLFVVDLEQPYSKSVVIDAGAGTGLSAPALITDTPGIAKIVYAGDLSGNIWRFSIDNLSSTGWTKYKVFTADLGTPTASIPQPIVAAPTIGYNAQLAKNMVYVGTGKYHDLIDKSAGSVVHSFYAVPDMGATGTPTTRTNLLQKTLTTSYASNAETRTVSTTNPNWTTQLGWYIDLDHSVSEKRDERVTTKAILIQDKLLITTLIPSEENCFAGGSSWLMQVTAVGDMYVNPPSNILEDNLYATELFLGDQNIAMMFPVAPPPSSGSSASSSSAPGNCGADLNLALINSGTSAAKPKAVEGLMKACMVGRQSWRQLK